MDSSGQTLWGFGGLTLADSIQNVGLNPPGIDLEKNIDGGGTFAWGSRTSTGRIRTFTQRVRSNGAFVFPEGAKDVSGYDSSTTGIYAVITSDRNTSIFLWADNRAPGGTFAQKMDTSGQRLWDTNDVFVCNPPYSGGGKVTTDCAGGFIVAGFVQSDFSIRVKQVSQNGNLGEIITAVNEYPSDRFAARPILYQNYPNPFNASTVVRFIVPQNGNVKLQVFNTLGQQVRTLFEGFRLAGVHELSMDASQLASGVYLYRLQTTESILVRKLILIK